MKKIIDTWRLLREKAPGFICLLRGHSSSNRNPVAGMRIGNDFVEWTTLRDSKAGVEILSSNNAALPFDPLKPQEPDERAAQIKIHCSEIKGPVTIGIAPDKMLMRVADLPTTDPVEMANMIRLQVDTFSPFPDDRINVSYEVLKKEETGVRVLIAVLQKDLVEMTGNVLGKAGLDVQRIDAEAMAWWRLLSESFPPADDGRYLFLVLEAWGGVWIAIQNKMPISFRAVTSSGEAPFGDFASELARDAGAFLLSIEVEHGSAPVAGIELFCRGVPGDELASALREEIQHNPAVHSLDLLPPVSEGLARRFAGTNLLSFLSRVRDGNAVIDLVPESWRSTVIARRLRWRLIAASIGVLAAWLVAIAVFFGAYQFQYFRLARAEKRQAVLQKPADEVRLMQNQAKSFEQYLDRKSSALECLREVSRSLPAGVLLTSFQFKKGKNVVIRGEALAVNAIYDYKQALDKSQLFLKIDMGAVQPGKRKDTNVNTFQMTARFKEHK